MGARPQFIKAAIVSRAIVEHNQQCHKNQIVEDIVHTGQHFDESMSDIFFKQLQTSQKTLDCLVRSCVSERLGKTRVETCQSILELEGLSNLQLTGV